MAVSGAILKRLAALDMSKEALCEVLSIIGDMQAPEESRKEKDRERKRRSKEIPRTILGKGAEIPADPLETRKVPTPLKETQISEKKDPLSGGPKKRGTRLADDFVPDESKAIEIGLSPDQAQREAAKFIDYWRSKAGSQGVKLDWDATWRNWCRTALERRQTGPPLAPKRGSAALSELCDRPISDTFR